MTREEAISLLSQVNHILVNSNSWLENTHEPLNIAFNMAIKALEQEPITKNDLGVDAISRIETIDYLCKHCPDDGECFKDCDEIKHLRNLPSVTPQPKTGHWIEHEHNGIAHIECSECSSWFLRPHLIRNRYCPNCGAKMTEKEG